MAMEKPLVTPDQLTPEEMSGAMEIEIVNPESVSIETEDGGLMFDFDPESEMSGEVAFDANLAEYLEEQDLAMLAR